MFVREATVYCRDGCLFGWPLFIVGMAITSGGHCLL